ncbi:TonB-dependent receptor plug domain-containing protein [Sinomicrobium weinanense]|uniref:TonB-dependent receptor plug domain-containing protein n=1 Tax=Sinomicrobium weinanense TaxID=2842200 RepID=A0A926Q1J9_9FLAO|nr:TonB-dependent receptor plug domain-containing protein [Sinomicrobium weinanense]MBC9794874.1 TonB-dependent receptor plug domain-containing protein [Sinomicrobium weinanense]MBU3125645.1 Plug domain-containing protein [Sinomicrobium weinanense]
MKKISLFALLCFFKLNAFAQEPSSAYIKVKNIMQEELNYTLEPDHKEVQVQRQDTTIVKPKPVRNGIGPCMSLISANPAPLVVLNGAPIAPEELKNYEAKDIDSIKILKNKVATAVYGARASNGVILLYSGTE